MSDPAVRAFPDLWGVARSFFVAHEAYGQECGWLAVRIYLERMSRERLRLLGEAFADADAGTFGAYVVAAIQTELLLRRAAALDAFRAALRELPRPEEP